jgi:hypothetical protein
MTMDAKAGLNEFVWDMREGALGGRGAPGRGGSMLTPAPPGDYLMTLEVDGKKLAQKARVLDPVIMIP